MFDDNFQLAAYLQIYHNFFVIVIMNYYACSYANIAFVSSCPVLPGNAFLNEYFPKEKRKRREKEKKERKGTSSTIK